MKTLSHFRLHMFGAAVLAAVIASTVACIPRGSTNENAATEKDSNPSVGSLAIPADPGRTMSPDSSKLALVAGVPLFNLEKVGRLVEPSAVVEFAASDTIDFEGWAVDSFAKNRAGGVNIVINGKHYPAKYGISRLDVASHFKVGDYAYSGFSCSVPASQIGKGRHKVAVHVIANDGKTFYKGTPVSVNVR